MDRSPPDAARRLRRHDAASCRSDRGVEPTERAGPSAARAGAPRRGAPVARPRAARELDRRRDGGARRPRGRAARADHGHPAPRARSRRGDPRARGAPAGALRPRCVLRHADFRHLDAEARACGAAPAHAVLLDLGLSSFQLERSGRGFSFQADEGLDMPFDRRQPLTAAELVMRTPEPELARIIYQYGEEPAARRIARRVVAARGRAPIRTTRQLADLVAVGDPAAPAAPSHPSRDPARSRRSDRGQRRARQPRGGAPAGPSSWRRAAASA